LLQYETLLEINRKLQPEIDDMKSKMDKEKKAIKHEYEKKLDKLKAKMVSISTALRRGGKKCVCYTIIIPTKCTRFLLLKAQDITVFAFFVLYFCPYVFQPAWVIFRVLNASAWLKLLLITIY
jgi:uncharacterized membrane protein (DUF106 family)